MNTAIVPASVIAAEIPGLLEEIASVPEKHYLTLGEESALHQEPRDVWVRPASDFWNPEKVAQNVGNWSYEVRYADFYDMNGRQIKHTDRSQLWHGIQEAITPSTRHHFAPNAVHRYGHDYLIVGRGSHVVAAETTMDGERAFETISAAEQTRRDLAELELLMPAVHAAKPEWADEPTIRSVDNDTDADTIAVTYSRGGFLPDGFTWDAEVSIDQYVVIARQTGAVVRVGTLTPTVYVGEPRVIADEAGMRPDQLRALGDALRNMADALEPILAVN